MIDRAELTEIGKIVKTHGVGGELVAVISREDTDFDASEYLVCDIDGIYVPFFLASYRYKGVNSVILKFDDIDNIAETATMINRKLYIPKEKSAGTSESAVISDTLSGYSITISGDKIGIIVAIDGTPENPLFVVEGETKEYLIPATEDFVTGIDDEAKTIEMKLPEGLLEL